MMGTGQVVNCVRMAGFLLIAIPCACLTTMTRHEGIIAEAPLDQYMGSQSCAECHEDEYEDWSKKIKSNFVRYRSDHKGAVPGDWGNAPLKNSDDVFLLVGKKKKVAFADKSWRIIPHEYHFKKGWKEHKGWAREITDYRRRCGPCHLTGLNPETLTFKELNVGCESCHGPGRQHSESPSEEGLVKVPGKTDANKLDTCRKCHNNRNEHARALEGFTGSFHETTDN